jgi:glutamate 5-kinase
MQRVVVKLGTSVLTLGSDRLHRPHMVELVRQMAALHAQGVEVILVSSGAVAAGWERLGFPERRRSMPAKQLLAAVGQSRLMHLYEQLFEIYGVVVAQALLTRDDLRDRRRYLNARNTLLACLQRAVLPIINENDAVAIDEIRVGDNDTLSALVANLVDADKLIILTDIAGLYTADPRRDPQATLIAEVPQIDESIWALAGGVGSHRGTGGMRTKIHAAELATASGTPLVIASGSEPDVIVRLMQGERIGTCFPSNASHRESRKRWILAETVRHSRVVVDAGAVKALRSDGKSLLPAGIVAIEGSFDRGQTVRIFDVDGHEVARGLSQYRASDLQLIKSLHSAQIAEVLGYEYGPEAVHRDDMVVF